MHKSLYPSCHEFLELLLRQLYHNFLHIIIIIIMITHKCMASEDFLYILWGLGRSKCVKVVWQLLLWAVRKMFEHLSLQHGIQLVLYSVCHVQMGIVFRQNVSIIKFLGCLFLFLLFWSAWQEQFAFIVLLCDLKSVVLCEQIHHLLHHLKLHCKNICITIVSYFMHVSSVLNQKLG